LSTYGGLNRLLPSHKLLLRRDPSVPEHIRIAVA
jgi:hypothetical protein